MMDSTTSHFSHLSSLPILSELKRSNCKNILIAGCGGGFDVYSGLPVYFALKKDTDFESVVLANLTFSSLDHLQNDGLTNHLDIIVPPSKWNNLEKFACHMVHSKSDNRSLGYFPEKYLCQYLVEAHGEHETDCVTYTFDRSNGVRSLTKSYEAIITKHNIDAVIIVDGGTDSLMRGDEKELGSPEEDALTIASVYNISTDVLPMDNRFLMAIGFGVDTFHGVNHYHFLENVASIARKYPNGYLGAFSLLKQMQEFQHFKDACNFSFSKMSQYPSIVSSSIISAVEGHYGDYHAIPDRTSGSKLYIHPLMSMYWTFRVAPVFTESTYMFKLLETDNRDEVNYCLNKYRTNLQKNQPHLIRQPQNLPV